MIGRAEAERRKRGFLLCRYFLILVSGALGMLETTGVSPMPIAALVAVALFSNLYLGTVSPFSFFDANMQAPILVADTALVSAVLILARASQEFFLFFFFVLIMAAKVESLTVLLSGAAAIGLASFLITDYQPAGISPMLIRVPFMLSTALFYGYVVLPERTGQMKPLELTRTAAARTRLRAA